MFYIILWIISILHPLQNLSFPNYFLTNFMNLLPFFVLCLPVFNYKHFMTKVSVKFHNIITYCIFLHILVSAPTKKYYWFWYLHKTSLTQTIKKYFLELIHRIWMFKCCCTGDTVVLMHRKLVQEQFCSMASVVAKPERLIWKAAQQEKTDVKL